MSHSSSKAIVIGAGIAGLATAVRLAADGWQVEVFERNSYPGGKLSWFEQDGFAFDAGPSLFTQPHLLEALFEAAGEKLSDHFSYERVDPICNYFFSNGKRINAAADPSQLADDMAAAFGESRDAVLQYLRKASDSYEGIGKLFLENSLHRIGQFKWASVPRAIGLTRPSYLMRSMDAYNQSSFRTEEAVQLFNRYATYNGSNPYKAPAMLSMIPHLEMNEGTFYPKGGMISITNAVYELAKRLGVTFHFNAPVDRIIEDSGHVKGIVTQGENILAPMVVSNADAYFTYKKLLRNEAAARKVLKQERSSSALIFYWGIGKSFEQLHLHNIFFSGDYRREFQHLFHHKTFSNDPTIYINITSKLESGQAPQGKENWFVMINAPANHGQPWSQWIPAVRQQVIDRLSKELDADIASLIETEALLDPVSIEEKTASYMGSLYGTSSNSRLAAFLRHANFSKRIRGLYFAGGSVHPGGGIPLCLQSAAITAKLVAADYGRHRKMG